MAKKAAPKPKKPASKGKPAAKAAKASKPSKPSKPAKSAKSGKTAPVKTSAAKAPADLSSAVARLEAELRVARQNQIGLGKHIDEVGDVGERILDEIDSIRRDMDSLRSGPLASKVGRLEEAAKIMQTELNAAATERKGIIKELEKTVDDIEDFRDLDERCNAGPALAKLKEFDEKFAQMQASVDEARRTVDAVASSLVAKINELAAKFSMHSHFLKARNSNQDLFFHVDAPGSEGSTALPDAPRTLGVKPVRAGADPAAGEVDLRLTPPRHWEDPLIWFGNVGPIEKKK